MRVLEAGETPKGWGILIVFGMLQAWRMTMAPVLNVSGPYRVGTIALASSGA